MNFASKDELKEFILPVLRIKSKELNLDEDTIFSKLSEKKWKNANDLRLFQIIDDIMKLDIEEMRDA